MVSPTSYQARSEGKTIANLCILCPFLNSEKYSRGNKTGKALTREENNRATYPKVLHVTIKNRDHVAY